MKSHDVQVFRKELMKAASVRTTATFLRPFVLPGLDEVLPEGEYVLQTELRAPPGFRGPEPWKASVLVHLHPAPASPGLARTLTVTLEDLEHALARDKLSGRPLADFILEEMLADPMVRLFMESDGVTDDDIRRLHSQAHAPREDEP